MQNTTYPLTIKEVDRRKIIIIKYEEPTENTLNIINIFAKNRGEGGKAESAHSVVTRAATRIGRELVRIRYDELVI